MLLFFRNRLLWLRELLYLDIFRREADVVAVRQLYDEHVRVACVRHDNGFEAVFAFFNLHFVAYPSLFFRKTFFYGWRLVHDSPLNTYSSARQTCYSSLFLTDQLFSFFSS